MRRSLLISLACLLLPLAATAATLNVPSGHSTIQAALNAANAGDTIIVANGTYTESNVTVKDSNIILRAANTRGAIIDGNGAGTGITSVSGSNIDGVTIQGFEIRDYSNVCLDIRLNTPHNFDSWIIKDNYIHNCGLVGIEVAGDGHLIQNNLTFPILDFSKHSYIFPAYTP